MKQQTTPTPVSAPPVVHDTADREHIKALAAVSALEMPGDCVHCGGSGRSPATARRVVHCFGPDWFGESWDLARLNDAIDPAGHDLVVTLDGEHYRFAVKRPAETENAA